MKALSIRQPWAWLIVNGHKDIENRDWPTRYRGSFLVHAGKTCTDDEYEDATAIAAALGVELPNMAELERGGIVGAVDLIDCVECSESPWFFGRYGFVLQNATPLPFEARRGQLGFFEVPR